eukprot:1149403-Pelagomonas_calceolata.AAC.3
MGVEVSSILASCSNDLHTYVLVSSFMLYSIVSRPQQVLRPGSWWSSQLVDGKKGFIDTYCNKCVRLHLGCAISGASRLALRGAHGEFEELVPGKRLVLDWRFSSWCDGCMSKVRRYTTNSFLLGVEQKSLMAYTVFSFFPSSLEEQDTLVPKRSFSTFPIPIMLPSASFLLVYALCPILLCGCAQRAALCTLEQHLQEISPGENALNVSFVHDPQVVLDFEEPEPGNCVITLTQTGIPETDRIGNEVSMGLRIHVLAGVRRTVEKGMGLVLCVERIMQDSGC